MKIGIIQSPVTNDKETNLANAEESIRQAAEGGAEMPLPGRSPAGPPQADRASAHPRASRKAANRLIISITPF